MFWFILVALFVIASVESATNVSYDQQVIDKLADIDSTRTIISTSFNTELPALQNTRSITASLYNTLPNTINTDWLSDALIKLEAISSGLSGSNEAFCFQNYASTKTNIITQARQTYSTCTLTLTTTINQLIDNITREITTLNSLSTSAKVKVSVCGSNSMYRLNDVLFNFCMKTATTAYDAQLVVLNAGITQLQTTRASSVNTVATCIARSVARAESILQAFNDYIRSCISTSDNGADFSSIITNVVQTNDNTFASQITENTSTAAYLSTIKSVTQTNLNDATTSVTAANTAKALTYATAKAALDTEYANVSVAFAAAAANFSSNTFARTCVNNIRNALQSNLVKQATQIVTCVQNIQSSTLSSDLTKALTSYNQLITSEGLVNSQCLGRVEYLFMTEGIKRCREEAEGDETENLTYLNYKVLILKQAADLVSTAANQCGLMGRTAVTRQNTKDVLSFETCILKSIRQVYVINL